jgi:hypothetical protein
MSMFPPLWARSYLVQRAGVAGSAVVRTGVQLEEVLETALGAPLGEEAEIR